MDEPVRIMPKYSYNQEEMLEIAMQIQKAGIRSHFLPVEFNNEMGLFDPDLWIRSIWEKDEGIVAPRPVKKQPPVERLKAEGGEEIVLSPQRRSFGQGCQSRPKSPRKKTEAVQSEGTVELLHELFPGFPPKHESRKPAGTGKATGHPSAVVGAARGRNFQPTFSQRPPPPEEEDHSKFQHNPGSWREQMTGPMGTWRKRGNSGGDLGGRRFESGRNEGGRNRGTSGHWGGGRNDTLPEWMDEDADETMELGGFDEHENRKAREKEMAAHAPPPKERKAERHPWAGAGTTPPPPEPAREQRPASPPKQPGQMLEKESDFADMFGLTPSQVDAGVDILFPFMSSGSGGGFLSGSSVSVPGQTARVSELKAAGQSRFSRFFGAEPSGEAPEEQRAEAQRVAASESDRIMSKLISGAPNSAALAGILSNGPAQAPPMPQPASQPQTMSLQEIEAKLREQNGLNGQRPIEGAPGRGLFGRKEDEEENRGGWQSAKGNPLSDPASQAHLLHSLNKLSLETAQLHQAEAGPQHQASALHHLLQQTQRQQAQGFPPQAFGPGGRLQGPPHPQAPPMQPPPQRAQHYPANLEAQQTAVNFLKAVAAKAQAQGGPPPEQAFLLAQLMARSAATRPQGPPPPQMGPPRPHTVHMPPFVQQPPVSNGGIPPPEIYHLLAAQMRQQAPPQPPPPKPYGTGFMPLSVLKQAAGRKMETSVDAHLAALGKSGSDGTSDEDESYGAKRMTVASGSTPGRGPFQPQQPPPQSHHQGPSHQQYLAMLQATNRDGREGAGNAAMINMARAQQISGLQAAAARGDPSAIQALQGLQHAAHQHRERKRECLSAIPFLFSSPEIGGNELKMAMMEQMSHVSQASAMHQQQMHYPHPHGQESEGSSLARLFGAGGGSRIPASARPLSLEEVERSAAKAAAQQPFI